MTAPTMEMRSQAKVLLEPERPDLEVSDGKQRPDVWQVRGMEQTFRLAVPRKGHVLSTIADYYGRPIREAVAALTASLMRKPHANIVVDLRFMRSLDHAADVDRSDADMAAWLIVSMWVAGVATKAIPISASLRVAEQWFFGGDSTHRLTALPSGKAVARAEELLRAQADASAYFQLLPYILDPHGPGSRLSVRRDPSTRAARARKRTDGVFYTPSDVAGYMVEMCFDALKANEAPPVFDPACGTGVFLRAALRQLLYRYPDRDALSLATECLFGADIDPWALDATAFVLLTDARIDFPKEGNLPIVAWQRIRRNLACIDTLRIDPAGEPKGIGKHRDQGGRVSISSLFPALKAGPTVIVGNPPYADLGVRSDVIEIGNVFRTIAVKQEPSAEIYLAFVEQMIRLAQPNGSAGALIVPLSIACNVGPQFTALRKLIAETSGLWRFAFFDREPHALFGEDVKTRNAIALWSKAPRDRGAVLATGPLRKWRGDNRAMMFKSLRFTQIEGDIRAGIPKIEGPRQAAALRILCARWNRLEQVVRAIDRRSLAASLNADENTVFVGPTAYNFLNVFLRPPRTALHRTLVLSEHPLHAVTCASRQDARAVFALLSSHLAYWWWHAHGDGFHVSRRFICEFPFGVDALSGQCGTALSMHGAELWATIRPSPIISLNRGRTSLAFTPNGHDRMRRKLDEVLANLAGLDAEFVDELQQFTAHTVAATLSAHATSATDKERA